MDLYSSAGRLMDLYRFVDLYSSAGRTFSGCVKTAVQAGIATHKTLCFI